MVYEYTKVQIVIIGYLDNNQRNITKEAQQEIVNQCAYMNNCSVDMFLNKEDIKNILGDLNSKSATTLIVANITSLGNKLTKVVENIEFLISHGLSLISAKENLRFDSSAETAQLLNGIKLSIDIRNSMVSTITKKALDDKKAKGYKLGRDFGLKNKKYIWEGKEADIKNKLLSGMTRQQTADEVGISVVSLYNYLKLNPELKEIKNGRATI